MNSEKDRWWAEYIYIVKPSLITLNNYQYSVIYVVLGEICRTLVRNLTINGDQSLLLGTYQTRVFSPLRG